MTQLTKENLIDLATQAKFNELGGILRYGVTEEALADFARLVVEAVRTTEIDPRFPAACYGNDLKSQTSESVSDSAAPEAAGMVTAEQFVQEIRKTCRDRTLYLMNRCGITNGDPVYRELLRLAFDVRKISAAPAQPQEQTAPQECQLTDAELSDPEYMRGYVAELQATISDLLAAPAPQPQEQKSVATVRVTHKGYGMELSTYVAYALPEGMHDLYAAPVAAQQEAGTVTDYGTKQEAGQARELPDDDAIRSSVEYVVETQGFDVQDERESELVEDVAIAVVRHLSAQAAPAVPDAQLQVWRDMANEAREYANSWDEQGYTGPWGTMHAMAAAMENMIARLASAPAQTVPELPEAEIVKVLASLGIDTYPSKYGFPELQVSATSTPMIPEIVRAYLAAAAPAQEGGKQE